MNGVQVKQNNPDICNPHKTNFGSQDNLLSPEILMISLSAKHFSLA